MSIERGDALYATASVQTLAAVSSIIIQNGVFASVIRNDAGDYTLVLGPGLGIDELQCTIYATARGNVASSFRIVHVSDEEKRVICTNCQADVDFDLFILRP